MEQLKLERDTSKLILVGEVEKESPLYKLLYTYINEVSFGQKPANIHFSAVLGELNDYSNASFISSALMRIVSGTHKGRRFSPPKGLPVRPTTDFAKEGLFNMLRNKNGY